jgi:hypothetical protein
MRNPYIQLQKTELFRKIKFTVTEDHLKLSRRMCVDWSTRVFGAPEIDPKRPYGNSNPSQDVAEILGWKFDPEDGLSNEMEEKAMSIHRQMDKVLQIGLVTGKFEAGEYVMDECHIHSWRKA